MKVSSKGRYALRLMIDLAEHHTGKYTALKEISQRQGISIKYLEQIVVVLGRAGYLRSVRGAQGGYMLAKEPSHITAGDVLRVTEGPLAPVSCLEGETNPCQRQASCPTLKFWEGFYQCINQYADSVTIQDLVRQHRENAGWDFVI